MAFEFKHLHFVLVPLFAQGHMIPMIDMAKMLAEQSVMVTLVTTPQNTSRFHNTFCRATKSGLSINLLQIPFPSQQFHLPLGCENLDTLPSRNHLRNFYNALDMLQDPLENYIKNHPFPPSCIISDKCISWTTLIAQKFNIPRLVFHGMSCFSLLSSYNIKLHGAHRAVNSDTDPFVIPGVMPQRIEITRAQLPGTFVSLPDLDDYRDKMNEAEMCSHGIVVNSFEELEQGCAMEYEKVMNKRVWCIGPLCLSNKESLDKFERGNKSSIEEKQCLEWLNFRETRSVIYVCLGSLCRLVSSQLIEIGLGLEASNRPFIWVVKTNGENYLELEKWLQDENFEGRIKGRGLLIKGWAPQILILSHPSIGGFLTHCGWNSTIESVCFGVPMITWPLFAEQFLNEKLIVEVLKIGVRIGVEVPIRFGDEKKVGVLVKKSRVVEAIEMCMEGGEEGEMRRNRVKEHGKMATKALEVDQGSSHFNISCLIQDIMDYQSTNN
ncbi:UDP-glycosyltransferase 73D1 [Cicer arietinum]|uniref:Glycosyltransferase n=1 Tax=Cicer arietinum TaxID=3827 RepID=A0A067XTG6_CICAR|nr:UDP-glycosyltransferase 73D1 [Cicer arietinum]AGU14064.1 UDP-glycosyltransferase [Cicer arietinum]